MTPERSSSIWGAFLRSQSEALPACDFFEIVTLSGARLYVFAVIEHAYGRVRILGATARPSAIWVVQAGGNLIMDLERGCKPADENLDRALIWNQRHLLHALREIEAFYNEDRPHLGLATRATAALVAMTASAGKPATRWANRSTAASGSPSVTTRLIQP